MTVSISMKKCNVCQDIKPGKEFYGSDTNTDGKQGKCKLCKQKQNTENRAKRQNLLNNEKDADSKTEDTAHKTTKAHLIPFRKSYDKNKLY